MAYIQNFWAGLFSFMRNLSLRIVSVLAMSLTLVIAALVSLPLVLDLPLVQKKLAERLSDWSGGNLSFNGAIQLRYFPQVSLSAEHVSLKNIRHLPNIDKMRASNVTARFEWWPMLLGNLRVGTLELDRPEIYLASPEPLLAGGISQNSARIDLSRIFRTVRHIPFSAVSFSNALLVLPAQDHDKRVRHNFSASLAREGGGGNISGRGHFVWNNRKISLSGASNGTASTLSQNRVPLDLKLENPLFQASFRGSLDVGQGMTFLGAADVRLLKARRFSRWMGLDLADGTGLSEFSVAGDFTWADRVLAFRNATLDIDSNRAEGAVSLNYGKARPFLDGTLAFAALDLTAYRDGMLLRAGGRGKSGAGGTGQGRRKRLLQCLDVDLRLSATRIAIGDVPMTSAAATLFVNEGKLLLQLADATVFGGRVYGQVRLDTASASPGYSVSMSLKNIAAREALATVSTVPVMDGRVTVKLELAGQDGDRKDLLQGLDGQVDISSVSAGHIGLDIVRLFQHSRYPQPGEWAAVKSGDTAFQTLKGSLVLKRGRIVRQAFNINENGRNLAVSGQTDLVNGTIRWLFDRRLVRNIPGQAIYPVRYGIGATRRVVVLVEGAWETPGVRRHYVGVNAAPATMALFPGELPVYGRPVQQDMPAALPFNR